jgi:hypothetical protein
MSSEVVKSGGTPKWMCWTGCVISAIPVVMMGAMAAVMLMTSPDKIFDGMKKYGYPEYAVRPIVIAEITCAVIYAIPQTAVLGAVLLTGYLGGAVATHVRAGESTFYFPVIMGVLVWLGLLLRDSRVRRLLPLRR